MTESQNGTHYSPAYQRASNLLAAVDWQEIQLERMLSFEELVRIQTSHKPGIYNDFISISVDHTEREIDVSITRKMHEALFVDFPDLRSRWRELVYECVHHLHSNVDATASGDTSHRPKDGYDFLNRMRNAFRKVEDFEAKDQFLETLKSWRARKINTIEMRTSCFKLLKPFPDLIQELNEWLPPVPKVEPSASPPIKQESIKEEP